jgi:hypothetical protein
VSRKRDDLLEAAKSTSMNESAERMIPTFCSLCGPSMGCGINCCVRDGSRPQFEKFEIFYYARS